MDVHASPAALPEGHAGVPVVQVGVRRPEGGPALERDMPGRLTALPDQNGATRAHALPGPTTQRVQAGLTHLPWDAEALSRPRVQKLLAAAPLGAGGLGVEDTGFPTPGTGSGGGARQEWGPLGQGGPCRVAVTCGAADAQATGPVAVRWPLPEAGAEALARRQQARVPAEAACHTKPERALARREQARGGGVPSGGVGAEAGAGGQPPCWASLEGRQAPYVVGGRRASRGSRGRAARRPVRRGAAGLQTGPRWPWRPRRWRPGPKGGLGPKGVAVRGWRVTAEGQRPVGGGVGDRATRGQPEARKSHGRHLPATAPLAAWAGDAPRREAVEPCHAEAKGEPGWDHSQGRLGPGCHRQAVTVRLAARVLVWLARRPRRSPPRRGRPRAPCSPSAGAAEALAARDPSRGRPVAAPPRRPMGGANGSVHGTLLTKDLTE
jgi:hypothetical protein